MTHQPSSCRVLCGATSICITSCSTNLFGQQPTSSLSTSQAPQQSLNPERSFTVVASSFYGGRVVLLKPTISHPAIHSSQALAHSCGSSYPPMNKHERRIITQSRLCYVGWAAVGVITKFHANQQMPVLTGLVLWSPCVVLINQPASQPGHGVEVTFRPFHCLLHLLLLDAECFPSRSLSLLSWLALIPCVAHR